MSESKQILESIVDDFSVDKFKRFFREKSRSFSLTEQEYSRYNDNDFKDGLKLGEINFQDGDSILISSFEVKKELSERLGKRAQYEKTRKILKSLENQKFSAGIFIFYDVKGNFRFSLVYPESIGKKRQWNNFRRFTYFVSKEFTNKTFFKQIGENPFLKLEDIKRAFSISAVTKLFYDEFFKIYDKLVESVKNANNTKEENAVRDFVLLFAIRTVFIGFIQKKKWLGGDEKFVQNFFLEYKNKFYNKNEFYLRWLVPLFFEALNSVQGTKVAYGNNFFSKETEDKLQMAPYLNGGLFKSKRGYDDNGWFIPDKEIKEFFDFLFAHSFTIEENSLEDEDLQLNPEFLGIIFERLVSGADGAVYTPRTEVDLMCRLSLVKWLQKNLQNKIGSENLYELFFKESEKEEDQKHGSFSQKEAQEIIDKLENIAVCDPSVGSGAFLVGMMQVLDETEQLLKSKYNLGGKNIFDRKKEIIKNCLYGVEVKEWAVWICQLRLWLSLFVDAPDDLKNSLEPILPSLDFKVRQGDSLVQRIGSKAFPVSGHSSDLSTSIKSKITKLKNLKLEYFDNKSELKDWSLKNSELMIYGEILSMEIEEKEEKWRILKNIKPATTVSLFGDTIIEQVSQQKLFEVDEEKIKELEIEIAELKEQKVILQSGSKPLIWSIEFAEVFSEKGGFDIIIGNPPYVRQEEIADPMGKIKDKKEYKEYLEEMVKLDFPLDFSKKIKINGHSDLCTFFYVRGLRLLNSQGIHTFICSNSWLDAGYGAWLQDFLLKRCSIDLIVDNHSKRSFESASVNTIISIINAPQKKVNEGDLVKFIAFKKPFEEIAYTENMIAINGTEKGQKNDIYQSHIISIKDLKNAGTEYVTKEENILGGKYVGDKWGGRYLRAPDIFFTILIKGSKYIETFDRYFTGERYLNTGGADGFFILSDVLKKDGLKSFINNSKTLNLPKDFFSGEIESSFLKPLIKNQTKKDKSIEIKNTDAWCLVVDKETTDCDVESYIKWGEDQGYSQRSVTKTQKPWYKPTNQMFGGAEVLLPRSFNDIFVAYYNPEKYLSLRYYRLHPKQDNCEELIAYLNSTLFWFIFEVLGNKNQGEGVLDFYMEQFLLTKLPIILLKKSSAEFLKLKNRPVVSIFEECGINPKSEISIDKQKPCPLSDRKELDDTIFEALGLSSEEREEVYRGVCSLVWDRINKAKSV